MHQAFQVRRFELLAAQGQHVRPHGVEDPIIPFQRPVQAGGTLLTVQQNLEAPRLAGLFDLFFGVVTAFQFGAAALARARPAIHLAERHFKRRLAVNDAAHKNPANQAVEQRVGLFHFPDEIPLKFGEQHHRLGGVQLLDQLL